jgi:hypothetical protein
MNTLIVLGHGIMNQDEQPMKVPDQVTILFYGPESHGVDKDLAKVAARGWMEPDGTYKAGDDCPRHYVNPSLPTEVAERWSFVDKRTETTDTWVATVTGAEKERAHVQDSRLTKEIDGAVQGLKPRKTSGASESGKAPRRRRESNDGTVVGAVGTQTFAAAKSVDLETLVNYFRSKHPGELTVHWCLCRSHVGKVGGGGKASLSGRADESGNTRYSKNDITKKPYSEGDIGAGGSKDKVKAPDLAREDKELDGIIEIRTFAQAVGNAPPPKKGKSDQTTKKSKLDAQMEAVTARRLQKAAANQPGQAQGQGTASGHVGENQ